MAMRRRNNPVLFGLLALMLVFPPLTGVVAGGLGLDLSHHHCESDAHGTHGLQHHDGPVASDATHKSGTHLDRHGAPQSDPYQCDQCHMVLAAIATDLPLSVISPSPLPSPETATMLLAVRPPPAFRPPIS